MRIVYISHAYDEDVLGNTVKIRSLCKKFASYEILPLSVDTVLGQVLDLSDTCQLTLSANYLRALAERRVFSELWVCSEQSPRVKQEVRLAKEFGIPVHDLYSDYTSMKEVRELAYELNVEVRGWAMRGLAAELETPTCTSDKSGTKEKIDEVIDTALRVLKERVSSLADSI